MPLVSKNFSDIITFSRTSGATWFNATGTLIGIDFSSTSETVGTGSKSFTLNATAGVNRYWTTGAPVRIGDASNPTTNYMDGVVSSYTASTQVLVVNVTSVGGSGTFTAWRVSNLSPRFDYDPDTLAARGFLIEEARTNLVLQSQDFATTWLTSASPTITTNTTAAPDGTTTADTLASTVISSYIGQTITFTGDGTKAYSFFIKAGTSGSTRIFIRDVTAAFSRGQVDIVWTGGVPSPTVINGSLQSVQACPNGWYRVSVTADSVVAANTNQFRIQPDNVSGTGDIIIWGFQAENGVFSTSYIPTTTIQATRSADVASVNTLSPWFNATEGTLFAEYTPYVVTPATAAQYIAIFSDGTVNNSIDLYKRANADVSTRFAVGVGAPGNQAFINAGTFTATTNKIAAAYKANDFAVSLNGTSSLTDPSGSVPSVNNLLLGSNITSTAYLGGYLRRVTYYPRRLSNAELQAITA